MLLLNNERHVALNSSEVPVMGKMLCVEEEILSYVIDGAAATK